VCRSAREKPYLRAAPSEYRVDTANGQDNDDAQTRTGELWASYAQLGERSALELRCGLPLSLLSCLPSSNALSGLCREGAVFSDLATKQPRRRNRTQRVRAIQGY
jgi:hypothetical protein